MSQKDKQEIAELLAKIAAILTKETASPFVGPLPPHYPK
jgi:hypothetical protein